MSGHDSRLQLALKSFEVNCILKQHFTSAMALQYTFKLRRFSRDVSLYCAHQLLNLLVEPTFLPSPLMNHVLSLYAPSMSYKMAPWAPLLILFNKKTYMRNC